ncbi:MAG: 4'-phosphopantetheinyl transferase superfamily protein, partial [Myxococcales bacterium]
MLGNDLIDLQDLDARPESFRAGFDARVFCAEECRAIAADRNPLARRWAHWGAKEAAYKLARQIDPTFIFSPRRLVAAFEPATTQSAEQIERRGRLVLTGLASQFGLMTPSGLTAPSGLKTQNEGSSPNAGGKDLSLEIYSFETSERIHVVAVPAKTDWNDIDYAVCRMDAGQVDSSSAVRALAVCEIGRRLGIETERISIGCRGRIPTILLDGHMTSFPLSLSHHGDWIGYAAKFLVVPDHREPQIEGDDDSRLTPSASGMPVGPLHSIESF